MCAPARTLASAVAVRGLGLFTGRRCAVEIGPADPGSGIVFESAGVRFPARAGHLDARPAHAAFARLSPRCTTLAAGPEAEPIHTVEHVLGALAGLGVTDAVCVVTGDEIPIVDGSAGPFVEAIRAAGLREAGETLAPICPTHAIEVASDDGTSTVRIEPADAPHYRYELGYGPSAPIPPQTAEWGGDADGFAASVAPARTFSLRAEAEAMRGLGLFRAFGPADLPVVADDGSLIDNAWRGEHEPARHKLLDLIGDLALVGRPICARITAVRSGHALHHKAAIALLDMAG